MDLTNLREQIDEIDVELVSLFVRRMELAAQVAEYKKANNLPIKVPAREQEILQKLSEIAGADMASYIRSLYTAIFELSRTYQYMKNSNT